MKSFWMGVLGSFVGMLVFVSVGIIFGQDIFQVEKDGTPRFKVTADGKIPVGSTGSYENLVIQNNAANPNARVDISADAITIEGVRLESLSVSATITTSGAGGLDTGSEAGSTWVYVWVITNNDGTSSNGLLSTSSTSPTMPSGFTKKRRVGAVRNDGSSNFLQFFQEGGFAKYVGSTAVVTNGTATSFTDVDCSSAIPPTSRRGLFSLDLNVNHTVPADTQGQIRWNGATAGSQLFNRIQMGIVASTMMRSVVVGVCDTDASQFVEYLITVAPDVSGGVTLRVVGYYDRI